jgi:predicted MFS family arabinose efflux permease
MGRTIAPLSIPMTTWVGYHWTFFALFLLSLASAGIYWYMFMIFEKNRKKALGLE